MGGIGTYIKASSESDEDVGDRANDSVRVDALQLRSKVVGEGANLGFTQQARIEYALNGGRINTDAVDNSGSVDLSDHEVNLKTLVALLLRRGVIAGDDERNQFLAELTDDVCCSVLANNYWQSLCLSLERERCLKDVEPFLELADQLENAGLLDRTAEFFPVRKEIQARAGQGLTRPELAVLMACAKLALKQTLLEAPEFLSTEWTRDILAAYFPEAVRSRYAAYLGEHSLGREIAATMICNRVINQAGAGLLMWTDGLDAGLLIRVVGAYLAFDQILDGGRLREQVCALDSDLATARRYELLLRLEDALAFLSRWALKRGQEFLPEPALVGDWRTDLQQYLGHLVESLSDAERPQFEARLAELAALGFAVPEAHRLAFLDRLRDFPILMDLSLHSREALRPRPPLNHAAFCLKYSDDGHDYRMSTYDDAR
ncbi:MAG: NAD-specific glutamate dehydrogenase [Beijerinckiaceae bacterium]|nr:MAG: NAD-specific glutamate dehydrogenase [Beijerinckiaceae bacterium]